VVSAVKVFCCVLVLRGIAAANVSTFQAQTQMDPAISGLHAFFANMFVRAGEFDLIEMRAIHEILRQIFKSDQCPYKPSIDNLERNKTPPGATFRDRAGCPRHA
jgi:hypothetical protein